MTPMPKTMMTRLTRLLLALSLLPLFAITTFAQQALVTHGANLRADASSAQPAIGALSLGETVKLIEAAPQHGLLPCPHFRCQGRMGLGSLPEYSGCACTHTAAPTDPDAYESFAVSQPCACTEPDGRASHVDFHRLG